MGLVVEPVAVAAEAGEQAKAKLIIQKTKRLRHCEGQHDEAIFYEIGCRASLAMTGE